MSDAGSSLGSGALWVYHVAVAGQHVASAAYQPPCQCQASMSEDPADIRAKVRAFTERANDPGVPATGQAVYLFALPARRQQRGTERPGNGGS